MINYKRIKELTAQYDSLPTETLEYLRDRLSDAYLCGYRLIPWSDNDANHKTAIITVLYNRQNEVENEDTV